MVFEALQDPTLLLLMAAALVSWQTNIKILVCAFYFPWHNSQSTSALGLQQAPCMSHMHLACDMSAVRNNSSHTQVSTVLGVAIKEEREQNAWSEGVAIWVAVIVVSLVGEHNHCFALLLQRPILCFTHSASTFTCIPLLILP